MTVAAAEGAPEPPAETSSDDEDVPGFEDSGSEAPLVPIGMDAIIDRSRERRSTGYCSSKRCAGIVATLLIGWSMHALVGERQGGIFNGPASKTLSPTHSTLTNKLHAHVKNVAAKIIRPSTMASSTSSNLRATQYAEHHWRQIESKTSPLRHRDKNGHRVCALVVSTTLAPHTAYLDAMRDTLQADSRVRLLYLFNGDSGLYVNHTRGPTPPSKTAESFCVEHGLDECIVIHEGCVQPTEWSSACVSRLMLSTRVAQMKLHESCDFIIKLDPDSFIIPSSTMEFLKDVDRAAPVYFGTWSSSSLCLSEGLCATVMMGQGNFMASAYTWRRMTMDGMEGCFPKLKGGLHHHLLLESLGVPPTAVIHPFEHTSHYSIGGYADEVITSFCAWHTFGAPRITNWRPFVFSNGNTNETTRLILDAPKETQQCVMLIHKFDVHEWRGAYQYLEELDHTRRKCVGYTEGVSMGGVAPAIPSTPTEVTFVVKEGQFLWDSGSLLTRKGKNLPIIASFSVPGGKKFWDHAERAKNENGTFPSDWDVDRKYSTLQVPGHVDVDLMYPPKGQRFRNLSVAVAKAKE